MVSLKLSKIFIEMFAILKYIFCSISWAFFMLNEEIVLHDSHAYFRIDNFIKN